MRIFRSPILKTPEHFKQALGDLIVVNVNPGVHSPPTQLPPQGWFDTKTSLPPFAVSILSFWVITKLKFTLKQNGLCLHVESNIPICLKS